MKALITGGKGFIGSHLKTEFEANGYEVFSCDLREGDGIIPLDILNQEMLRSTIEEYHPNVIVNMAGQANVGLSWSKPQLTVELNTIGLINVLEAVKVVDRGIRVIAIGSSDEYGNLKDNGKDVKENLPVSPITPYAVSKHAQELFAQLYANTFDMEICMVRLFNLAGVGQAKGYMISDFASSIAEVEIGKKEYISVGNLSSARDFTNVKDACRAIRLVSEKGHKGEVYNICSGSTYTAQEILDQLISMARTEIDVRIDMDRMRPSDTPVICGNHDKITKHTGWQPSIKIQETLLEVISDWRGRV